MFNNPCSEVLKIAEAMMLGELDYKAGEIEEGLDHLHRAVELDDGLLYDEPWGRMQPTRHALGALLMEAGRVEEAERVYRADLGSPPHCRAPASIRATSGACTASTNAWQAAARRRSGRISGLCSPRRPPAPKCRLSRPATAGPMQRRRNSGYRCRAVPCLTARPLRQGSLLDCLGFIEAERQ
ncbi:MAG: hypothetical protein P8Z80_21135 [Pseudolabrys sp.]